MAIDFKQYVTKKNALLAALGVAGVGLLIFSAKVVTGDISAETRKRYADQKAGVASTPPPTPIPSPVESPTPPKTAKQKDDTSTLPDAKPKGAQSDETFERPETPGLVEVNDAPDLDKVLPNATTVAPPPVPSALLNQQLPNSQLPGPAAGTMPRIAVAPNRYLFNNLSPSAVSGKSLVMSSRDPAANINLKTFSPQGEAIVLATLSSASTRDAEIPIVAGVWQPFIFNGNKLLDFGDKVIGYAEPGKIQGRATVKFQKIIFKNGKSLSINALGTDSEGNLGIPGVKVGDVLLNSIGPILLDLAGAVISSFEQSAAQVTTTGGLSGVANTAAGLVGGTTQSVTQNAAQSAKNAGLSGATSSLQKISDLLATDLEENKPYLLVLPGTPCKALLISPIDVSKASFGQ